MALVVQKYDGSSVSGVGAMWRVTRRIVVTREAGNTAVAVVSAMGDTTDELLNQAAAPTTNAPAREMGILLPAGERVSVALLVTAVSEFGVPARVYTGVQVGVLTDSKYGKASIVGVPPERVVCSIQTGSVATVVGFQGINEVEDTITLGRGGSDTAVVTLAAALNADVCKIYTDVDGLFTADPRVVPTAKCIESLSNEETLELTVHGVKTLHLRAVGYARRFGVPLHVRPSSSDKIGTWVYDGYREGAFVPSVVATQLDDVVAAGIDSAPSAPSAASPATSQSAGTAPASPLDPAGFDEGPSASVADTAHRNAIAARAQARPRLSAKEDYAETPIISGIAHDRSQGKITLVGMPDVPDAVARIFAIMAGTDANIDMIVQDIFAEGTGPTNISFTCPDGNSAATRGVLEAAREELGFRSLYFNPDIGILSLAGAGTRSNPGISARLFGSLSEAGVNIHMTSTSEICTSVVVDGAVLDEAVRAAHSAFGLDAQAAEAVVYGEIGRRAIS